MNKENLKLKFKGYESIKNMYRSINNIYSQSGQDLFVLSCLDGKREGTFLELGCHHPYIGSNSYFLESEFNWSGISVDINQQMISLHNERKNKKICCDATKLNFYEIYDLNNLVHIDYLSIDLEPASITYQSLENIPLEKIEFSIITYEHDLYRFGDIWKNKSRNLLEKYGYKRIASDVLDHENPYEDWYFNPKYISYEKIKVLESESVDWSKTIFY